MSTSFPMLVICLFGVGLALGCDYPTAHVIISESIASGARGRLVLSAFAFQAVGALAGTAVGLLILDEAMAIRDWRWMYATAIVPAVLAEVRGDAADHGARASGFASLFSKPNRPATALAAFPCGIDALLIVGIVCAVLLVERVGRIRLQVVGFVGFAASFAKLGAVLTWRFAIETPGLNLETIGREAPGVREAPQRSD